MIKILSLGKSDSGGNQNLDNILKCLKKKKKNIGIHVYKKKSFLKLFNVNSNDIYVFWMCNHLTFILIGYLFFLSFFKKITIYSVVHNSFTQPQTSNIIHNFISTAIEQFTFLLSDKKLYISKILFLKSKSSKNFLLSDVLPFDYAVKCHTSSSMRKDIDLLFIGRNLPYKNLNFLKLALSTIEVNFKLCIAGKDVSKEDWSNLGNIELKIIDEYLDNNSYFNLIKRSKLVVLPYKSVSAAGPLVDALANRVNVLVPDLPFFLLYKHSPYIFYYKKDSIIDLQINIKKLALNNSNATVKQYSNKNIYSWNNFIYRLLQLEFLVNKSKVATKHKCLAKEPKSGSNTKSVRR